MRAIIRWMKVPGSFPVEQVLPLLAGHEKTKAASYRFERDRRAYCAAHVLLRLTIDDAFAPQSYQLLYGLTGKPHVLMPNGKEIHVSLSHSNRLAAVAVASECRIGVDIEFRDRALVLEDLLPFALSDSERTEFAPSTGHEHAADTFLCRWTLKEAIAKATGQGLTADFQSFSVRTRPSQLITRAPDGTPADDWQLWAASVDCGYLALAAHTATCRSIAFDVEQYASPWNIGG
jgi:4'-phosphopantetheinyl transferase